MLYFLRVDIDIQCAALLLLAIFIIYKIVLSHDHKGSALHYITGQWYLVRYDQCVNVKLLPSSVITRLFIVLHCLDDRGKRHCIYFISATHDAQTLQYLRFLLGVTRLDHA